MKKIKLKLFEYFPKRMNSLYYRKVFGKKLNLKNPKTYSEKLQFLKFYYAEDEKVILAGDKVGIHEYLKEKSLENLLVPMINVYDCVEDIVWEDLPQEFVMKKSNSSGMNIIINNKKDANKNEILATMAVWMKEIFGIFGAEKHYSKMKSRILIEKYISLNNS
ncbi:MAG: ATP-grasp fold amidoligase family protein [Vagococcus sp.]|uniref:ATP-grasp fold amidoligase family protein n=1 Tax=Vagococcus sp. TaxID=1933889 RepID=UPI002FC775E6